MFRWSGYCFRCCENLHLFSVNCVLIPKSNTNMTIFCNISIVTYSIRGQCGSHTTVPVFSVRMKCIKSPQKRRLNTYVTLSNTVDPRHKEIFYQYHMSIQLRRSYILGFKHVGSFQKPGSVLC